MELHCESGLDERLHVPRPLQAEDRSLTVLDDVVDLLQTIATAVSDFENFVV